MRWFQGFIAALLFGLLPPGWARAVELPHPDSITISDAWAEFITARAESATAHVTVNNHGLAPDRLESALSPVARHVELRREGAASSTPTIIGAGATRELALSLTGIDQRLTLNKRFPGAYLRACRRNSGGHTLGAIPIRLSRETASAARAHAFGRT